MRGLLSLMNVYDFDRTIYPGDSSIHFWKFCMRRYPKTMRVIPRATVAIFRHKRGSCSWSDVMETFFTFLAHVPSVDEAVEAFWDKNGDKIYEWYLERRHDADLIVSAAPVFLIAPICRRLGVDCIATEMDIKTGKISGKECSGEEKSRRYSEKFGDTPIESFYSDSLSDAPLARLASRAFRVDEGMISEWDFSLCEE